MGFLRNTTAAQPIDGGGDRRGTISRSSTSSSNSNSGGSIRSLGSRRVRNQSAASPLPSSSSSSKLGKSFGTLQTGDTASVSTAGSDSVKSGNSGVSKSSRASKASVVSSLSASTFGTIGTTSSNIMMSPPTVPKQKRTPTLRSPLPRLPRPSTAAAAPAASTTGSDDGSRRDSGNASSSSKGGFKSPKFGKKLAVQPLHLSPLPGDKTPKKKKNALSPKLNRLTKLRHCKKGSSNNASSPLSPSNLNKKQVTFSTEFDIFEDDATHHDDNEDDIVAPPATQVGNPRRESWGVKELAFDIKSMVQNNSKNNDLEECLWFTSAEVEKRNLIDNKVIAIMNESSLSNIQNDDNISITLDDDGDDDEYDEEDGHHCYECIRGLENQTMDGSQRTDHSRRASRDAVFEERHHSNGNIEAISKAYMLCTQLALHRAQDLALQDETYVMEHVLGGGGGDASASGTDTTDSRHKGRKHRHHRGSNSSKKK